MLAKGVGARFGDVENAKGNITEAYQVLKRLNEGEKLFDEEIFAANQALISAYDEGEAGFEEVVFAQNFLFDKEGQNNRGVDRAINELMDRIMLADVDEDSDEARVFMAEKAKLALGVCEAYYARKNELIGEAKANGKTISLGVLTACARKAMHEVRDMFDFEEDEEGISFAELENELEENYPNADKAVVWKEFAKRAPYAKDKEKLFQRLAETNIGTQYAENEYAGTMSDATTEEGEENDKINYKCEQYIDSKHWNFLGQLESRNRYGKIPNAPEGAWGKYQMRANALIDTGYMDKNKKFTGKDGIRNIDDFYNHPEIQEKAIRELMDIFLYRLRNYVHYDSTPIAGKVENFNVTVRGMLMAAHRAGQERVKKYLTMLEKDKNGRYYFPYDKVSNKEKEKFEWVETRLRQFAD